MDEHFKNCHRGITMFPSQCALNLQIVSEEVASVYPIQFRFEIRATENCSVERN